ncbi:hypothetical protein RYX51_22650 (plasmid) [Priestia filamentosa]|nr:hypothetical protein RYX51_22650 [Priestia filamentosa]
MRWGDGASPIVKRLGNGGSPVKKRMGSGGAPVCKFRPSVIGRSKIYPSYSPCKTKNHGISIEISDKFTLHIVLVKPLLF